MSTTKEKSIYAESLSKHFGSIDQKEGAHVFLAVLFVVCLALWAIIGIIGSIVIYIQSDPGIIATHNTNLFTAFKIHSYVYLAGWIVQIIGLFILKATKVVTTEDKEDAIMEHLTLTATAVPFVIIMYPFIFVILPFFDWIGNAGNTIFPKIISRISVREEIKREEA